ATINPTNASNAYILYNAETRKTVKDANPNESNGEISKICSSMWKALSSVERALYTKKQNNDMKRFEAEYKAASENLLNGLKKISTIVPITPSPTVSDSSHSRVSRSPRKRICIPTQRWMNYAENIKNIKKGKNDIVVAEKKVTEDVKKLKNDIAVAEKKVTEEVASSAILQDWNHPKKPFSKKHGFSIKRIPGDGDCFYNCIVKCLDSDEKYKEEMKSEFSEMGEEGLTVKFMRKIVASKLTEVQLDIYKSSAIACPEDRLLDFVRVDDTKGEGGDAVDSPMDTSMSPRDQRSAERKRKRLSSSHVRTLEELRDYAEREGKEYGTFSCLWADDFAIEVIAKYLRLDILDLTKNEEELVKQGLEENEGTESDVVASLNGDSVVRENLWTLRPEEWLSDEVIHFFFSCLQERDKEACESTGGNRKRSWFFKSFFFKKLLDRGRYKYKNVEKWSKNVPGKDIFELNSIYWPVNIDNWHWIMLKADMKTKVITYYDSFRRPDEKGFLEATLRYFKDEWKAKHKPGKFPEEEWTLMETPDDYPRQLNGFDCGVFTCAGADFISAGKKPEFNAEDAAKMRKIITLEILKRREEEAAGPPALTPAATLEILKRQEEEAAG
ncbi:hypothetical protein TrRE_jg9536, partial [Triparma retinervis]